MSDLLPAPAEDRWREDVVGAATPRRALATLRPAPLFRAGNATSSSTTTRGPAS